MSQIFYFVDGEEIECPICRNNKSCRYVHDAALDIFAFDCDNCGRCRVKNAAWNWLKAKKDELGEPKRLREISEDERIKISIDLRKNSDPRKYTLITIDYLERSIRSR